MIGVKPSTRFQFEQAAVQFCCALRSDPGISVNKRFIDSRPDMRWRAEYDLHSMEISACARPAPFRLHKIFVVILTVRLVAKSC